MTIKTWLLIYVSEFQVLNKLLDFVNVVEWFSSCEITKGRVYEALGNTWNLGGVFINFLVGEFSGENLNQFPSLGTTFPLINKHQLVLTVHSARVTVTP